MNAKKIMLLLGLTTALGGSAVARDNDSWGWHYDTQDQGWEDYWEEEELVSIPSSDRHVRPQESANRIAKVIAYNKTNQWVKIVAGGQVITWLGPMERRKLRCKLTERPRPILRARSTAPAISPSDSRPKTHVRAHKAAACCR